jgi:NADH:ubiquinone oxidoreductase subunit 5 (subunit L)/multisubunit Na+/H+ antiporter MnhA subunit
VALAAPALALVGTLAVASFVKLLGTVFAGAPRSAHAAQAHDPDLSMLAPMWFLAACCVFIGLLPVVAVGVLDRAVADWAPHVQGTAGSIRSYVPLGWLTITTLAFLGAVMLGIWAFSRWRVNRAARAAGTWDCGYARPTARMQYSGSSFSQMIVELLSWALWPRRKPPHVKGVLAAPSDFASDVPDVVLDRGLLPAFGSAQWVLGWARVIQRGPIQVYLLYVLGILILLLLFA